MIQRRLGDVSVSLNDKEENIDEDILEEEPEFCMDAGSFGNVTRFINHSCEPNLFVQCVLSSHHDPRLARIVLFAAEDIPPMQVELLLTLTLSICSSSLCLIMKELKRISCFFVIPVAPCGLINLIWCFKQELTYDYGYALDSVIGSDGKVKTMPCYCGTGECRKRLY